MSTEAIERSRPRDSQRDPESASAATGPAPRPGGALAVRAARWSIAHRKLVVFGWLGLVIIFSTIGGMAGTTNATTTQQSVGDSGRALRALRAAGLTPPAAESVLISTKTATDGAAGTSDPAFRAVVNDIVVALGQQADAKQVASPYASGAISADGHSALVSFSVAGDPETADGRVGPILTAVAQIAAQHPTFTVAEVGDASAAKYLNDTFNNDFAKAEWTAVPVALIILLLAFGTLVAAVLPVVLALTAYLIAAGVTALLSHSMPTTPDASSVMLLVGLAVGVDYCLFYLRRARTERAGGQSNEASILIAAGTSGRTVLVSGVTVIVAMAGMFITGIIDFEAIAASTIVVVLIAVIGALTVLPALMAMLGDRVDKGRLPIVGRRRQAALQSAADGTPVRGAWSALLSLILRRPALVTVGSVAALLALAVPLLSLHTAQLSTAQELSPGTPLVSTSAQIESAFPGSSAEATVVISTPEAGGDAVQSAVSRLISEATASGHATRSDVTVHAAQKLVVVHLALAGTGTDPASTQALHYLRGQLIPQVFAGIPSTHVWVAGVTAQSVDFGDQLRGRSIPVFTFVLLLAFVLMLSSFRSLTIAVTTVALNLLSVGAAYGVLTLVFQHNVGASLVGAHAVGAINSWVPIFLFVLLFGLSMDYHVFVVSTIKENHDRGLSTAEAIRAGIGSTASVITSAALIMVGVFAIFATLSVESMKQVAVGLAVAVFIDAAIIRALLLPAAMATLAERNWFLPRWLGWVPELSHSDAVTESASPVSDSESAGRHSGSVVNVPATSASIGGYAER